jgi:hypothetical protein
MSFVAVLNNETAGIPVQMYECVEYFAQKT